MAKTNYANGVVVLSSRHYAWLVDHIAGMTNTEIATKFGVTQSAVSKVLTSDVAEAEIQMLREKVAENAANIGLQIQVLRPQAVKVIQEVLHDTSASEKAMDRKVKVALAVLDSPMNAREHDDSEPDEWAGVHVYIKGPTAAAILVKAGEDPT